MNAARIRAVIVVGALLVAAVVLAGVTIAHDNQSHASYASSCPAGTVAVVTNPLPDYDQITLKIYNGSKVPGQATALAKELGIRGFKVQPVTSADDKPTTNSVAQIYYGPAEVAAAWVVRAEFLLTGPDDYKLMHFSLKNKTKVVEIIIGTQFRQLGATTEVNQAIAALRTPSAPPGTCSNNP